MTAKVVVLWTEHLKKVQAIQKTALQLFAHPDATAEQLATVHMTLVEIMKKHREIAPKVRAAWPKWRSFVDLEN